MATERRGSRAGWIAFGGTMLLVIGSINIFQGVLALVANEQVVVVADDFVGVDFTSWGWILVLFALTVRWSAARDDLGLSNDRPGSIAGMPGDPLHGHLPHETASYPRRVT